MSAPRLRIFSDLHYGDPRCTIRELDALRTLFADTDEIVLNGDTLDTIAPQTRIHLSAVLAFFARPEMPRVTFLTGNHDPDISPFAELGLLAGRVWITHGDLLFEDIAPWSHQAPAIRQRLAEAAALPQDTGLDAVQARLRLNRIASRQVLEAPLVFQTHALAGLARLAHTVLPPSRLWAMLRAWRETPARAADWAQKHRAAARVVIVGHTHRPGVWRVGGADGIVVINTGSFGRPLGGAFVEIQGNTIRVVRIRRCGNTFAPGRVLAEFAA